MDSSKTSLPNRSWKWLPEQMPRVAALIAARRKEVGDAHVNECWRRGVVLLEPGWFFAVEGALAVGVPAADWDWRKWPELQGVPLGTAVALVLKTKEAATNG